MRYDAWSHVLSIGFQHFHQKALADAQLIQVNELHGYEYHLAPHRENLLDFLLGLMFFLVRLMIVKLIQRF